MILSARMRLVPATVALARAELTDRPAFARLLSASVPEQWPPATLADALPTFLEWLEAATDQAGWYVWYALICQPGAADVLGASVGFKGPPQDGRVEIGYSVLPQFQGQGYATEMVQSLTDWAFHQPGVEQVVAETGQDNAASLRVLHKAGFAEDGLGTEPGDVRLVRSSFCCGRSASVILSAAKDLRGPRNRPDSSLRSAVTGIRPGFPQKRSRRDLPRANKPSLD